MGLRLKIEGNESIHLPETSIITVQFGADIPHDSNARSTDLGSTVLMKGKILAAVNGEAADDTSKIARWSLVPAENSIICSFLSSHPFLQYLPAGLFSQALIPR